jgi:hypothetical protein
MERKRNPADANMQKEDARNFAWVLTDELSEIQESRECRKAICSSDAAQQGQNATETTSDETRSPTPEKSSADNEADPPSLNKVIQRAHKAKLVGLAFSGGGIRSATFNLGVLQGLANHRLLPIFDYLSTVSGGGYIGSWFASWVRYKGIAEVAKELKTTREADPANSPPKSAASQKPEPEQIRFLRRYSNFLTPRKGWLGLDSLSFCAAYMRNLLLNQILLVLVVAIVLLVPRLYVLGFYHLNGWLALSASLVLLGIAIRFVNLQGQTEPSSQAPPAQGSSTQNVFVARISLATGQLREFRAKLRQIWTMPKQASRRPERSENQVIFQVVLPFIFSTLLISAWLWESSVDQAASRWAATGAVLYMLLWLIPMNHAEDKREESPKWRILFGPLGAGAVAGLLLLSLSALLRPLNLPMWDYAVWMPLTVAVTLGLATILHIGLAAREFTTEEYEWWNRLAAETLKWLVVATLLATIAMYGPKFLYWIGRQDISTRSWLIPVLIAIWLGPTLIAVLARKSEAADSRRMRIAGLAFAIGPYIFALGLLVVIAWALSYLLPQMFASAEYPNGTYWPSYATGLNNNIGGWLLFLTTVILTAVTMWLSRRIGVNTFSIQAIYGTRLIRAYLGASNPERDPHPFIGFDPHDNDVKLVHLRVSSSNDDPQLQNADITGYQGPYPIINAAMNLVAGRELAWQQRKAASFVFTPRYCGYDIATAGRLGKYDEASDRNYRPTEHYAASVSLARAVTISGAAASPSMGYYTSDPMALLMTVFNVRLGSWLGNPGYEATRRKRAEQGELWAKFEEWWSRNPNDEADREKRDERGPWAKFSEWFHRRLPEDCYVPSWKKREPSWGMLYLLYELFGRTDAESEYVYLSDGGHFENLGIYELVRRRCRYIIACDAECDPGLECAGLGNAIEKCRSDFGIEIEIDLEQVRRRDANGLSQRLCAVGRIRYSLVDGNVPDGTLIYVKPALVKGVPEDIVRYHAGHCAFPHEPTTDQWFDESQFESYRRLGQYAIETVLEIAKGTAKPPSPGDCDELFRGLRKHWYTPSTFEKASFPHHEEALSHILTALRRNSSLEFLDAQFYPLLDQALQQFPRHIATLVPPPWEKTERNAWNPSDYDQYRAAFYLCQDMIKLMEDVYNDLNLDQAGEFQNPDHRGWTNLFRSWAGSRMFRFTWAVTASTYGARFQTFCENGLGLELGKIEIQKGFFVTASFSKEPPRSLHGLKWSKLLATGLDYSWTKEGFDYYEAKQLNEFFQETVGTTSYSVIPFLMNVDDPLNTTSSIEVKPLPIVIGFAVLKNRLLDKDALVYLYIRSYLRRMGLARKALRALLDWNPEIKLASKKDIHGKINGFMKKISDEDRIHVVRLFEELKHEGHESPLSSKGYED